MSEWCQRTLGDLIHVKHGYAFKGEFFVEEGEKLVLKPGNFPIGGGITLRPGKDAYYTGDYPPDFELAAGDLLVVMTDLTQAAPILGAPAFVPAEPVMLHNQRLGLVQVKPGVEVDRRFLYYAMLSDTSRSQIRATATGATVRHTAPERIYRVKLGIPDLSTQRVIGDVLGSIDDLIENNRRRIEVLEEMARAIYREWFVKFRYPGHGDVPMVDSALGLIPEGWTVHPFAEVASFVNGFAFKPSHWGSEGRPIIKIKELKQGVTKATPRHPAESIAPKYWVERGDLLFSWSADLGVYLWDNEPGLLNQHLFTVRPEHPSLTIGFLYHSLTHAMPKFRARAQGTTMRHIKRSALTEVEMVLPPGDLMSRFTRDVKPLHEDVAVLRQEAVTLEALRDLLLPRLVTGQIDVSTLDLDVVVRTGEVAELAGV